MESGHQEIFDFPNRMINLQHWHENVKLKKKEKKGKERETERERCYLGVLLPKAPLFVVFGSFFNLPSPRTMEGWIMIGRWYSAQVGILLFCYVLFLIFGFSVGFIYIYKEYPQGRPSLSKKIKKR
jgi:hypothetical protein